MRETLIANGVRNMKQFGYPKVNTENILTDHLYSAFFRGMVEGWIEDPPDARVKLAAMALLEELPA